MYNMLKYGTLHYLLIHQNHFHTSFGIPGLNIPQIYDSNSKFQRFPSSTNHIKFFCHLIRDNKLCVKFQPTTQRLQIKKPKINKTKYQGTNLLQ